MLVRYYTFYARHAIGVDPNINLGRGVTVVFCACIFNITCCMIFSCESSSNYKP